MTSVYVIQAEGGPVKIGLAADPDKRLAALRTGTPFRLSLAHVEEIDADLKAAAVERAAHALLNAAHAHGEWFNVSAQEARSAVQRAITELQRNPHWEPPRQGVSGRQIAAARTMLGIGQAELASSASISVPTLKRMEAAEGPASGMPNNVKAVIAALETAGILFIPADGGGPGVRLREPHP